MMRSILAGILILLLPHLASSAEPVLERVQTIALKGPVGGMDHLAIDSKRERLFVANTSNNSLDVVDLMTGKLLRQIPDQGRSRGVAYSPEVDRIFVGNGTGGVCNVIDGETYAEIKSFPLGDDADNVRYNPTNQRIYVVHADKELAIIDGISFQVLKPIRLATDIGALQLEVGRPRLYLNEKSTSQVVVIDTESDQILTRYSVAPSGTNAALAIDEPNRRLFVGCRKNPALIVMDSDSGKIVASLPIAGDVDDVHFDPTRKRIYASCGDGAITVVRQVDADQYEALEPIKTVKQARTSIFDPGTNRLYLAVPRRTDRPEQVDPEVWVYQAKP